MDPVVCCNVVTLFGQYGRGNEVRETLDWVVEVLRHRAYIYGTAFYPMPEAFLFFFHRMSQNAPQPARWKEEIRRLLRRRVEERIGVSVDVISLAMRLITCHGLGLRDPQGLKELLLMQEEDGGWGLGQVYQYGSKKLRIGNRGLSTALALQAVQQCQTWVVPV